MGFRVNLESLNKAFDELRKEYRIYAPTVIEGDGRFSDTNMVRYGEVSTVEEIEFEKKAQFSYKEVLLPIRQTLFFFTEKECKEPDVDDKKILIFLRSCDMHSLVRIDDIYLRNGFVDPYYKKLRDKAKFVLIGCEKSFESCFCVDMGTNKSDNYDAYLKVVGKEALLDIKDEELLKVFSDMDKKEESVTPDFVTETETRVNIPENLDLRITKSEMWDEYNDRCIACGRCNFVCPTCTCFTMQDIFYKDNAKNGERRRVWASCHVDGYTDMAGGHSFRNSKGERMRFKVMHKVYDYKKRWGYNMCVGCGRCDDICPEYISFSSTINKLEKAMEEVSK
ncbi:anaerobic sulfite reductase subunit AsrA [Clostridium sp.]|uniref:anaerobic sulfite reductase subunit AsrA n=1 Tax=Clostridium sp. TaxID=1506 RepID=UPI003991A652